MRRAERILVYGVSGSGKTVLAERISRLTDIPWHSVDDLTWEPGWTEVPLKEQRRRIEAICAGPQWILDTAYVRWLDIPLARADLIVGLDFPRWLSLLRLSRRTIGRLVDRKRVCNGNRESLRMLFSRESIIAWHFRSFSPKRQRIHEWAADRAGPTVLLFTSPRQIHRWVAAGRGDLFDVP